LLNVATPALAVAVSPPTIVAPVLIVAVTMNDLVEVSEESVPPDINVI
jgi:hypothetical protein